MFSDLAHLLDLRVCLKKNIITLRYFHVLCVVIGLLMFCRVTFFNLVLTPPVTGCVPPEKPSWSCLHWELLRPCCKVIDICNKH